MTDIRVCLRFLVTPYCNLRCSYCHNEFQGDIRGKGQHVGFDESEVVELLDDPRWGSSGKIEVKISGGEPLLFPGEVLKLLECSRNQRVLRRVLLSNMSLVRRPLIEQLAAAHLDEIRVNLPAVDPKDYSRVVGTKAPVQRTLLNCRNARANGIRVRANVVIGEHSTSTGPELMRKMISQALAGEWVDEMAFIVDARLVNPIESYRELRDVAVNLSDLPLVERDGRVASGHAGGFQFQVTRCIVWDDPMDEARPEADVYVIPPGKIMQKFEIGRAYL